MKRAVDREAAVRAIADFLEALGYDSKGSELARTPERVTEAFATELLRGEGVDLAALLGEGSEPSNLSGAGLVCVRQIQVTTLCPHHLLPGLGTASVGYLPGGRLIGLGTLARLVDACARRLTLQETIGERVVGALMEHADARGAFCQLELMHTCVASRGARQPEARLVTLARAGQLAGPEALAELALALNQTLTA